MGIMGYMGESPAGAAAVTIPVLADEPVTASSTLTADQNDTNITNQGAAGPVTHTLPAAFSVVGKQFTFSKVAAFDVTVKATGTDVIADSVAGGVIKNVTASETFGFITLKSVQTGATTATWIIATALGTWTTV